MNFYWVCRDCAGQYPMGTNADHYCKERRMREVAELIDQNMAECNSDLGLLWLVRIAYRWRQKMNGIERYGDRAALARRVCELMGDGRQG